jgi:hypothetical protein
MKSQIPIPYFDMFMPQYSGGWRMIQCAKGLPNKAGNWPTGQFVV